jgi:hypothetical protein
MIHRRHFGQRLAGRAFGCGCGTGVDRFGRVQPRGPLRAARAIAKTAQQAGKAVLGQEGRQRIGRNRPQFEIIERDRQRAFFFQLQQQSVVQ